MVRARFKELSIEEVANTLTHGFGLILSLAGFVFLVALTIWKGDGWHIASSLIYGLSLVTLYSASTLYHYSISEKAKQRLQLVDHCCIYLLIAGSYTPFTMIVLRDGIGPYLFIFAWVFAAVGIMMKIFFVIKSGPLSALTYLLMGWIGVVAVQPLYIAIGIVPIALIVAGGVSYSIGTIFFGWHSIKHHHAIWHLFVLGGSLLHFIAIAFYIVPYAMA
ncbi:MAG TPA: hemolysin III family protein [Pyrinomonadaceae bacterium]|nr:hemolysin III family protein [Pyrinomonadaceae bacterium]